MKILLPIAGILLLVVSILAAHYLFAGIGMGLASVLIFGPNVEDLDGKVGGIVYSKNKSGSYIKAHVKPRNPNSNAQSTIREQMPNITNLNMMN